MRRRDFLGRLPALAALPLVGALFKREAEAEPPVSREAGEEFVRQHLAEHPLIMVECPYRYNDPAAKEDDDG